MTRGFEPVADTRPADAPWPWLGWPVPAGTRLVGTAVELHVAEPERDAAELFEALDDDAVWRHVAGRPGDAQEWSDRLRADLGRGRVPWVVRRRKGEVVGCSSYLDVSVEDARLEIGSTAYTPTAWGTAVNPEAKLLLLSYAFDTLGAGRVQLKTDVRNERSQRAIARLGASYEGTLRRYQRRTDGTVRDTAMFSVVAEEWTAVRERLERRLAAR